MLTQDVQVVPGTDTAAVALFDSHQAAEAAVRELAAAEFDIKTISVVGRGYHSEETVAGFYNTGDRVKFWGKYGAFWGGLWGLFFGGLFLTVPFFGPVVVLGHLAVIAASALEGIVVVGGLSAIGAALYSIGIPKDSVLRYEKAIKADRFLLVVHGTSTEVERARRILKNAGSTQIDVHEHLNMHPKSAQSSTSN